MSKSCGGNLFVHTFVNIYGMTLNADNDHTVGSHGTRLCRVAVFAENPDGVEQSWSSVLLVGVGEAIRLDRVTNHSTTWCFIQCWSVCCIGH